MAKKTTQADMDRLASLALEAIGQLEEARSDLEAMIAADNRGWTLLGESTDLAFTREFRTAKIREAVFAAAGDPLIKQGLLVRAGYIWADGVQVAVRDDPGSGQDVQALAVAPFWDDPANSGLCGMSGQLDIEHRLGTAGETWLALPTTAKGRVRVRKLPPSEVTRIVTDPEDSETDWFYLREYALRGKQQRVLYPALGYRPAVMPSTPDSTIPAYVDALVFGDLRQVPIRWDSPVRKTLVNQVGGRGLGDAFASIPWSAAYGKSLEAIHRLILALARFAWQARTAKADKAAEAAQKIMAAAQGSGQTVVTDPNTRLEAIGKSGATIDSDSPKPFASMAAAGLGIPVTMLLGDPGTTGARAVAETLNRPTENTLKMRRGLHSEVFADVIGWVIDSAVRAGILRGTVTRDGDREVVTLPQEDSRTVVTTWPDFDSTAIDVAVKAIVTAQGADVLPDLTIARLLLSVLGVDNLDDILDQITDDQGRLIPPEATRAAALATAQDRGDA